MTESIFDGNPEADGPEESGKPDAGVVGDEQQADVGEQPPAGADESADQGGEGQPLILGKFKTNADLKKAYGELERQHTRTSQELRQLQRSQTAPAGQAGQAQGQTAEQRGQLDSDTFLAALTSDPVGTLQAVVGDIVDQQVAPLQRAEQIRAFQSQIQAMSADKENYPGFDELKKDVAAIFDEVPELAQRPDGLKLAYHVVRGQKVKEIATQVAAESATEAEKQMALKQLVSAGGTAAGRQAKSPEDQIVEAIKNAGGDDSIFPRE